MAAANTLAYYDTAFKKFIAQPQNGIS